MSEIKIVIREGNREVTYHPTDLDDAIHKVMQYIERFNPETYKKILGAGT